MTRVLIVGGGAVGQVYGHHIARGGAHVSMLVREKYADAARAGYDLVRIFARKHRVPARFVPHDVVTNASDVAARSFDQAWLTVATPPLLRGELDEALVATKDATVVSLQPGLTVADHLAKLVAPSRAVVGIIGMQSFVAPLEDSSDPIEQATGPGVAYFFPPFVESMFSGPADRTLRVVDALRAGGAPARGIADASATAAGSSALLIPVVAALETAGWSFDELVRSGAASLGARAAREASAVVAKTLGRDPPVATKLLTGGLVGLVARVAKRFAPLDIESFHRVHFSKVSEQTRLMLTEYAEEAERLSLDHEALDELRKSLDTLDAS